MGSLARVRTALGWLSKQIARLEPSHTRYEGPAGEVLVGQRTKGADRVHFEGLNWIGRMSNFGGDVSVGLCSTIGPFADVVGKVTIGRYCEIATDVSMNSSDHPMDHLSISTNRYLFGGRLAQNFSHGSEILIGHDVWIGHSVRILKGVSIGNGAVIGAGSVVTRDVPPYAVAAGNPARIIRFRFGDDIINLLLRTRWWDLRPADLARFEEAFFVPISQMNEPEYALLSKIEEETNGGDPPEGTHEAHRRNL